MWPVPKKSGKGRKSGKSEIFGENQEKKIRTLDPRNAYVLAFRRFLAVVFMMGMGFNRRRQLSV